MAALKQPYRYDDFAEPFAAADEPRAFSKEELEAAVKAARKDALESVTAESAGLRAEAMTKIASELGAAIEAAQRTIEDRAAQLTAIARNLASEICVGATARQDAEAALMVLSDALKADARLQPVLFVSAALSQQQMRDLKKAVAAIDGNESVLIESADDLKPGELRMTWNDGALERRHTELRKQIYEIFDMAVDKRPQKTTEKRS